MFLGCICEIGSTEEIYNSPMHPYTKFLLDSVPQPDPTQRDDDKELLTGEIPSPVNPPSGCPVPYSLPLCHRQVRKGGSGAENLRRPSGGLPLSLEYQRINKSPPRIAVGFSAKKEHMMSEIVLRMAKSENVPAIMEIMHQAHAPWQIPAPTF